MSATNNGGPAFPIPGLHNDADFNGMTLRDYFASNAGNPPGSFIRLIDDCSIEPDEAWHARWAYAKADAMLKAREA